MSPVYGLLGDKMFGRKTFGRHENGALYRLNRKLARCTTWFLSMDRGLLYGLPLHMTCRIESLLAAAGDVHNLQPATCPQCPHKCPQNLTLTLTLCAIVDVAPAAANTIWSYYCVDDVNTLSPNALAQSSCRPIVRRSFCPVAFCPVAFCPDTLRSHGA